MSGPRDGGSDEPQPVAVATVTLVLLSRTSLKQRLVHRGRRTHRSAHTLLT